MKPVLIVGNWKSNKSISEADAWIGEFSVTYRKLNTTGKDLTVVICAPFTLLYFLKSKINELKVPIELGAQDISPYTSGAYTGAVNNIQLAELVQWVIIGHTERRRYFGETDDVLAKKVEQSMGAGLKTIYCVGDETLPIPKNVTVVSYEPNWAIGTGHADTPHHANSVIEMIKNKSGIQRVIYGGSVTQDNVRDYITQPAIDGILPGGASLDVEKFIALIEAALRN